MSITRNVIELQNNYAKEFNIHFGFYLDILDQVYKTQSSIGLSEKELDKLNEEESNVFKSILFLTESSNTTSSGVLRLFSSNYVSDAFSLLRILYEIACLLHYGNNNWENKKELYLSFFKANTSEEKQRKTEWQLIKKAQTLLENDRSEYIEIRNKLNNYGGHISLAKIITGNVTTVGNATASSIFKPNFQNRNFLMGLDFLFSMEMLILEEYSNHLEKYNGVGESERKLIRILPTKFLKQIRPKLQALMK